MLQNVDTEFPAFDVDVFVEKPDLETAERYIATGDYYWNSGMFMFRASVFLRELEKHAPEMLIACRNAWGGRQKDLDFTRLDVETFAKCPADSIDYAVMEKTERALGSWSALWDVRAGEVDGNVCQGDVIAIDTRDTFVHAGSKLVATVGLKDTVVVETADAVLVASKDRVQDVKRVVEYLKHSDRDEHLLHRRVNRP